jgi:hypothetical protein
MQKKLRFSAGVASLLLVGFGLVLQLASLPVETGTTLHKRITTLGEIIIVVGGLFGLFAAINKDGRVWGLLAFSAGVINGLVL